MSDFYPLQELAEKLRLSRGLAGWEKGSSYEAWFNETLTSYVGTLLQAERAAIRQIVERGFEQNRVVQDVLEEIGGDASALSAVVQRETEKLREEIDDLKAEIQWINDLNADGE